MASMFRRFFFGPDDPRKLERGVDILPSEAASRDKYGRIPLDHLSKSTPHDGTPHSVPECLHRESVLLDLLRPPTRICLQDEVTLVLRVLNQGEQPIPANVVFCARNTYYRKGLCRLTEDIPPGGVAFIPITMSPNAGRTVKDFEEILTVEISQGTQLLRADKFKLVFRDFIGGLERMREEHMTASGIRRALRIYVIGAQGSGKSHFINCIARLFDPLMANLTEEANHGESQTQGQIKVASRLLNITFIDTLGVDKENSVQAGDMKEQLIGAKNLVMNREDNPDLRSKPIKAAGRADAVFFLVKPQLVQEEAWSNELKAFHKEALRASQQPVVVLTHVDEVDMKAVYDIQNPFRFDELRDTIMKIHKEIGVPLANIVCVVPSAAISHITVEEPDKHDEDELLFHVERSIYVALEQALRNAMATSERKLPSHPDISKDQDPFALAGGAAARVPAAQVDDISDTPYGRGWDAPSSSDAQYYRRSG